MMNKQAVLKPLSSQPLGAIPTRMLSTSHSFLFIHVPKTAGNAIQDTLRQYSDDAIVSLSADQDGVENFEVRSTKYNTVKHSTFSDYEREYGAEMMMSLFKFACIRNPWDRCMSHYFSPHRGRIAWDKQRFFRFVDDRIKPLPHYFSRGASFELVGAAAGNLDFVIRYETLERDFNVVCERIGLSTMKLTRRNESLQMNQRSFYDIEAVRYVETRFQEEIEYFGYSFE